MSDNERLWRALGKRCEPDEPDGPAEWREWYWEEADGSTNGCFEKDLLDYENDDAASVALLEELRRRGYWIAVEAIPPDEGFEQPWNYECWGLTDGFDGGPEGTLLATATIFRDAVRAGALALFYKD